MDFLKEITSFLAIWFKDLKNSLFKVEVTKIAGLDVKSEALVSKLTALQKQLAELISKTGKVEVLNQKDLDITPIKIALTNIGELIKSIPQTDTSKVEKLLAEISKSTDLIRKVEVINQPTIPDFTFPDKMDVAGEVRVTNLPTIQKINGDVKITNFPPLQKVEGDISISNFQEVIKGLQVVVDSINDLKAELPKTLGSSIIATTTGGALPKDIIYYTTLFDYADTNTLYTGEHQSKDASLTDEKWVITKFISANGLVTSTSKKTGVWNSRTSLF